MRVQVCCVVRVCVCCVLVECVCDPRSATHHTDADVESLRRGGDFYEEMRNIYYDTVLYSEEALRLLIKTVGADTFADVGARASASQKGDSGTL